MNAKHLNNIIINYLMRMTFFYIKISRSYIL